MGKYRTLLFDLDGTLLDFEASEKQALQSLFEGQRLPLTSEIELRYQEINRGLWHAYEQGTIGRDEVVNTRFSTLLKEYGLEVDGGDLDRRYRTFLEQGHQLIPGAWELVSALQHHYDLFIVTNGVSKTQDKRLRASGLYPMFKQVFVSEDTGFQKPMKEFFHYVFHRIPNFVVEQGLIIGDSLTSDIMGGQNAGIHTCWFNPNMRPNDTGIVPTYEITRLDELHAILLATDG